MNNYDHQYLNKIYEFGPYIYHAKLDQRFIQQLLEEGDKSTGDITHEDGSSVTQVFDKSTASSLATGHERQFNPNQQRWFNSSLKEVFNHYIQNRCRWHYIDVVPDYVIENVWINYQYANEYQPDHIHSGDFSWVIYCKVPTGLKEEAENYKKKGPVPGTIVFGYGEAANNPERNYAWNNTFHSITPEEGHMIIFPAQLRHFVPPFKCDGVRISVSGNGSFYMPDGKLFHMGEKRYEQ